MIRSFDLLDLPTLHRYRNQGLCMDSALALTWGVTMVPAGALLSYLAPATGIFTLLSTTDGESSQPVLGQVIHHGNTPYARLTFLAPESAVSSSALLQLLDHLSAQVGERGAHNLLAEVDESSQIYEALRRAGFAIYARQRIWKIDNPPASSGDGSPWTSATARDEIAVRVLYNGLVPGLVQQVEPPPWERLRGLALHQGESVQAFVDLNYGPRGVIATPYFHPDVEEVAPRLAEIVAELPHRRSRQVYMCVRSYQSWLDSALEALGAQPGPRQAVMVKRLVVPLQDTAQSTLPAIQGTQANPTVPFANSAGPSLKFTRRRPVERYASPALTTKEGI